jgi:hypothetical protein
MLSVDMNGDSKPDVIMGGNSIPGVFVLINTTTPVTVNLSPASVNFGPQNVGVSSQPLDATLTNTGNLTLTISSIGITGANRGDFSQTNTCGGSVPPVGTCDIKVTFTPTAAGNRSAAVTIADNAPNSPQSVPLWGAGQASTATGQLGPTVPFPSEPIGVTSPAQPVQFSVGGSGPLELSNITTTGDFAQTNNCPSLMSSGDGCTIFITFTPTEGVFVTVPLL